MDFNDFDINSDELLNLIDSLETKTENSDVTDSDVISNICPNCGSDELYNDSIEGILVCSECGLKIKELLDSSPDWNSINTTDNNNSRCGCPTNYYFPKSSLGTKVSNGKFSKISILEKWNQMPYKERSTFEVLKYIDNICSKHKLDKPIIDNAKNLFNKLSKMKHSEGTNQGKNIIIRGENRKSIIAACVFNGANLQGYPRTPKEIAVIFGITEKQVSKGCRKLRDIMNKDNIISNIKSCQSEEYIDRKEYSDLLKLELKHIELSKKIAKNIKKLDIASDHKPASIAAASVLIMASIFGLNINKKKISQVFNISQVTIIKTYKKIYQFRKIIISDDNTNIMLGKKHLLEKNNN